MFKNKQKPIPKYIIIKLPKTSEKNKTWKEAMWVEKRYYIQKSKNKNGSILFCRNNASQKTVYFPKLLTGKYDQPKILYQMKFLSKSGQNKKYLSYSKDERIH